MSSGQNNIKYNNKNTYEQATHFKSILMHSMPTIIWKEEEEKRNHSHQIQPK